ncbi:MAG: 4Fe-4S dicluster domain-containing protein [Oscillospiraceae bacterium]|nr:4Fe-4S dicluster domain-containing protein [Oscillospiraceae bacterium]
MDLLEQIRAAGVVGCGGAGFPSHVKFGARADTLIINAAECEPLLRTDRTLLLRGAAHICGAALALKKQLGAARAVIALKGSYVSETAALRAALPEGLELFLLQSFYPAGDEQVLVYEVTGRVVPPGGIPLDVGCVVTNAATAHAVWQAMRGRPFLFKYLTIAGAVRRPVVIKTPVGTPFADCLAAAGGAARSDIIVVSGGPMMGRPMAMEEAMGSYVTKTTSGFLVLPERARLWQTAQTPLRHVRNRAASACVQCSFCTQLCPRYLLGHPLEPHKIMRRCGSARPLEELLDEPVMRTAQYCCECGVCELIACPMGLQPRRVNAALKRAYAARGERPQKGETGLAARAYRDERRCPTAQAAARAGAGSFAPEEISFDEIQPERVCISLKSHIGVPAEPLVRAGQRVARGDRIAACPQGKLGADYHASIAGVIREIGENGIHIEGEG